METKRNCTQEIYSRLCEMINDGVIPWHKPWVVNSTGIVSRKGRPYGLRNRMLLGMAGEYLTFHQVKAEGGFVKKGAKSTTVYFHKEVDKKDENGEVVDVYHLLRAWNVFHIQDTDLTPKHEDMWGGKHPPEGEPLDVAIAYCERVGIKWVNGGGAAFYDRTHDSVQIPSVDTMKDEAHFWSTVFHELVHSTGSPERLKRLKGDTFGDSNYAKEELVAEIGAALCLGRLGLDTESTMLNSVGYIQHWRTHIRDIKPTELGDACKQAERACDFIFATPSVEEC